VQHGSVQPPRPPLVSSVAGARARRATMAMAGRSRRTATNRGGAGRARRAPAASALLLAAAAAAAALLLLHLPPAARAQTVALEATGGDASLDIPAQRAALEALMESAGAGSLLRKDGSSSAHEFLDGEVPWDTPDTSYCDWWGVSCCGASLSRVTQICTEGERSVSAVELSNMRLNGTLPARLGDLADLHLLDLSFNMG